jgi:pimeloyl-ACP methyl ester carboxylesterase
MPDERNRGIPEGYPRDLATLPESIQNIFHRAVGDIVDPKDRRFSKQAGKMGLWEPARFLKKYGAGIYMLAPYDPNKTPVLFVGGAGGYLGNWYCFMENMDRERFQAWYVLYPSGMRISVLGNGLNIFIRDMQKKFSNTKLHIIAHSMGGLVAREAIVKHLQDEKPVIIDQFITLSTPWNGHAMAEKGVRSFFTPVPSWHDVVPGNAFLQTVFNTPIKEKVAHHLVFGFVTGSDEDGSVALGSVLLAEAQDDAVDVRGFEGDHVGILSMERVFEYVEDVLLDAEEARTGCMEDDVPGIRVSDNEPPAMNTAVPESLEEPGESPPPNPTSVYPARIQTKVQPRNTLPYAVKWHSIVPFAETTSSLTSEFPIAKSKR